MAKVIGKEKNIVSIEFEIPQDKFEESVQKAYLKMRGKINIPGFRKGKAPRKIIELNYGKGVFYDDALDIALPDAYEAALTELALDPIDKPKIDISEFEEDKDIVISAKIEVIPDIVLPDIKTIEVEKIVYEVSEEDVDEALKNMQAQNARVINIEDRPIEAGDTVIIDYTGFSGDEQFEGGTAEQHSLEIGSNSFIPGFEDGLIGKNLGENVEINLTFPEDYHSPDLAGKEVVFKVKINEIKAKELPELDDEFAKDVSEFDSLEELRADTKENMIKKADDSERIARQNASVVAYVEASQVEVPDVLVEKEIDYQIKNFEQQMSMQGINVEDYYKMIGSNMNGLRDSIRPQALVSAKSELVIEKLTSEHTFDISDEEIDSELEKLAKSYRIEGEDKLKEFKENLKEQSLEYLKGNIQRRKAIEYIAANVKLVDKKEETKDETNNKLTEVH
ncbi:MAG: Cell division trigger factor [Clostridiales bacterium 38_11]|nr:MAG: Cell division trigger factor [Clostridiales bacterium 38_11]HBH12184.1 trigger factor [Clostridiales bacterium]